MATQKLMPTTNLRFALKFPYSEEEKMLIFQGFIPEQMEEKWFITFSDPILSLYRSWTGYCIFQVTFKGNDIVEVVVNQDPSQCEFIDRDQSVYELRRIIQKYLLTRSKRPYEPGG